MAGDPCAPLNASVHTGQSGTGRRYFRNGISSVQRGNASPAPTSHHSHRCCYARCSGARTAKSIANLAARLPGDFLSMLQGVRERLILIITVLSLPGPIQAPVSPGNVQVSLCPSLPCSGRLWGAAPSLQRNPPSQLPSSAAPRGFSPPVHEVNEVGRAIQCALAETDKLEPLLELLCWY